MLTGGGVGEAEMVAIAGWMGAGVEAARRRDDAARDRIAGEVRELTSKLPAPGISV